MDKKRKEALIVALAEKGKTYREIAKEACVSPNMIKVVLGFLLSGHPVKY
jgi:DNA-binding CsgD family transcriptional regulator